MLNIIFFFLLSLVNADVYLHNPRGNNNRCDERSNNRNNANRLFDSQNNAAGGYAVSCDRPENNNNINCYSMNYYTDTIIPIRWTAQHNCGENNDCQFILQYMCSDNIQNGKPQDTNGNTCTQRVPDVSYNDLTNPEQYGINEDYGFYQRCKDRERNPFLFTANQNLKGESAIYTRQNPNGNRYGFECPEERDYYPYWGESDWVDIAILTTNTSRCPYYTKHSRCNTIKHDCVGGSQFSNNAEECETHGGIWYTYPKYTDCNITCLDAPSSIINRLGVSTQYNGTKHAEYLWRLPSNPKSNCVLRLRYNISTNETPWEFTNLDNGKLKNNPVLNTSQNVPVRLAINTAQYGRTFEDRTYTFNIIPRTHELLNKNIYNLNVQGKRGNIAQVQNCIEYDFVPNNINVSTDDYIHFQFIGSDYNPPGNDGEGRAGTDRSNVVLIDSHKDNIPGYENQYQLFDNDTMYILASIYQPLNNNSMCYTYDEYINQNKGNDQQSFKNCALLNRAPPYFNMSPRKPIKNGTMKAMSSRNNNFSNRGQKLTLNAIANDTVANDTVANDTVLVATDSEESNSSTNNNGIKAGFIVLIALSILIVLIAIYIKRNTIKQYIVKKKKQIKMNTSTYI